MMKRLFLCIGLLLVLFGCQTTTTTTTTTVSLEPTSTGMYAIYRQQVYLHFKDFSLDDFTLDVFWAEDYETIVIDSQLEALCQATLNPFVTDWDSLQFMPGIAEFDVKARWVWTKDNQVATIEYQLSFQDIYYLVISYQNQDLITHSATLTGDMIPRDLLSTLLPE